MSDWLIFSRSLMAFDEYVLVWCSFGLVMWFTAFDSFGVIDGMIVSTIGAAAVFVYKYTTMHAHWQVVHNRSSVMRPWKEERALNSVRGQILAVTLHGFAFFGSSLLLSQEITAKACACGARVVCLDFSYVCGADSTAAGQLNFLVRTLAREGMEVVMSSLSDELRTLLVAHDVPGSDDPFSSLDDALQACENEQLKLQGICARSTLVTEQDTGTLLLDCVGGFAGRDIDVHAAKTLASYFTRSEYKADQKLFSVEDQVETLILIVCGSVEISSGTCRCHPTGTAAGIAKTKAGPGAILCASGFYTHACCSCNAAAGAGGCVVQKLQHHKAQQLEISEPQAAIILHKVLLRCITNNIHIAADDQKSKLANGSREGSFALTVDSVDNGSGISRSILPS
eukprot:gnl/TRDRNA2_/TRDRNA2_158337_c0_seq2.p1 gnl/TRDRNA2_/TRDRNA2_158337_c0~~gnl/TRDRNA2_/TRDRNA2_158337_c0_seq2.p1  ORF type:complete len:449 (-),score=73.57 gnl/TRDRNA2_/TRDRNA2_158337_c0_seq2:220-1410(-)